MAEYLSVELHQKGWDVVAVSMFSKSTVVTKELENRGVPVIFLGKKRGLDLSMVPKLRRLFKSISPIAVHSHRHCMQHVAPAAFGLGLRRIHTIHYVADKEVPHRIQYIQRIAFSHDYAIPVAINHVVQIPVYDLCDLPTKQVPLVYNGIPSYEPGPIDSLPGDSGALPF